MNRVSAAMFCPRCGNANITTKFCPKCGAAVPLGPDAGASPPDAPATSPWYLHEQSAYQANYERQAEIHARQHQEMSSGHKVRKMVPSVQESQSFFEKIKMSFIDAESFFTENDLSRELQTAVLIVCTVSSITFIARMMARGIFGLIKQEFFGITTVDYSVLFLASLFVFLLCPVSTLFAYAAMSFLERDKADLKAVFSIFGYAFLPFIITLAPVPYMRIVCMAGYIWLATVAFENAFNLTRTRALIFSALAPLLFVGITALIAGQACVLAFIK